MLTIAGTANAPARPRTATKGPCCNDISTVTAAVSASNQLPIALDDVLCADCLIRQSEQGRESDIVDAFEERHEADTGLPEHIAVGPRLSVGTDKVVQHPVSTDSRIDDAGALGAMQDGQSFGEAIGPTPVGIDR